MTSNEIIAEVKEFCAANASKENVEKYSRYFKGGINAWGLTQPQIDGKVKDLLKSHELTLDTVLEAAPMLIASDKYEEPGFALLLHTSIKKPSCGVTSHKGHLCSRRNQKFQGAGAHATREFCPASMHPAGVSRADLPPLPW